MVSLSLSSSSSHASLTSSPHQRLKHAALAVVSGASSASSSASSSKVSLDLDDEENVTITSNRIAKRRSKQKSQDDLRMLAVSTHMTEISYSISDIQTRIFEIQELRHKSQSSGDTASTTTIIDQSLINLDERLESVAKGMKVISDSLEPLLQSSQTPTLQQNGDTNGTSAILRKHATLISEWDAVQDESEVLREELKEDKWLTVFRTVTDQADGMMSSLEKAVNRCQDFIWQVHRHGPDELSSQSSFSNSIRSDKSPVNVDVFNSLLESFEAKKKHYVPATSKVLSIIDRGVQDRVTKNGETLRRHAESAQRWRNLRERIARTDAEMENVRKILLVGETASESGSHTSGTTSMSARNGYLATPPTGSRLSLNKTPMSTLSRSISPFRKFARKITRATKAPISLVTPLSITKVSSREPSSEPVQAIRRQRTSVFSFRGSQPPTPITPERPGHKYSQSLTPDSSPKPLKPDVDSSTVKSRHLKQRWNSSTKVEPDERALTLKMTPPRRPSAIGVYNQSDDIPPVPALGSQYNRSVSRASMTSSRPWTPFTSSVSTVASSNPSSSMFRPPSRCQTPSRAQTPSTATTPRPRPKTPSHIPVPAKLRSVSGRMSEAGCYDDDEKPTILTLRPSSPTLSATSAAVLSHPPRPPSRSMIPVPSLHLSSASRPSSSMSHCRPESPGLSSFRSFAVRAQTPESALRARAQQIPFYTGGRAARPSLQKMPPSSFRDASVTRTPGGSRPASRSGVYTPTSEQNAVHTYIPGNSKDPLDVEIAAVVNSIAHGLLVERVDPPLRNVPRDGEEIRAQYAFSNSISRKIVTCRLTTMTRKASGGTTTTKKVMCRVGGGWQDLQLYMLSRLDV